MTAAVPASLVETTAIPVGFIKVAEAAPLLRCSARHLRRRCNDRLAAAGLARKHGGDWIVARRLDARLSGLDTRESRDLRQLGELAREGYPAAAVRLAEQKRDLLHRWMDSDLPGRNLAERGKRFVNQCMADGTLAAVGIGKLSYEAIRKWSAAYARYGLRGLIRRQYPERGVTSIGASAWDLFEAVMTAGNGIKVAQGYDQVLGTILEQRLQGRPEWAWPALRTVQTQWERLHPAAKTLLQRGPHKMRANCIPKIQRDVTIDYAAGELLIGDERTLDFKSRRLGERGWYRVRLRMTAWRDGVSGRIVGWHIGTHANSDTILSAFRSAVLAMGTLPRECYIDNGRDYVAVGGPRHRRGSGKWDHFDAERLQSLFERVGVEVHYARPKHPWCKPIESSFSTLKEFDQFQAGYIGGSPTERPHDAERWTREHIMQLPTEDEVRVAFAEWLRVYEETPRRAVGTEGLSPRQAFERFYTTRPRRVDKDTLDILCRKLVGPMRIGRDGVRYQCLRYGTFDEAVWKLQGQEVYLLVDAVDRDSVLLCGKDGGPLEYHAGPGGALQRKFVVANVSRPQGYKSEELREQIAFQKRCEKSVKGYAASRDYLLQTPQQRIAGRRMLAAQARKIPDEVTPPAPEIESITLVRPDLAEAAAEVKRAAGADTMRRLSGANAAAEAMNKQRTRSAAPTLAELNRLTAPAVEEEQGEKVRRVSLKELCGVSQ